MHRDQVALQDIKKWLYEYLPAEKNFERFYRQEGRLPDIDDIYDKNVTNPIKNTGIFLYTDLKCIHSDYHQLRETMHFEEDTWFYPFLDVSLHKHPRYFPEFVHNHNFFELCYVLEGECRHTIIQESCHNTCVLKQGDMLIIPPGLSHTICVDSDSLAVNILLRSSTFKTSFLNNLPVDNILFQYFSQILYSDKTSAYIIFHTTRSEEITDAFFQVAYEYCNTRNYTRQIINLQLGILFAKLLRGYSETMQIFNTASVCEEKIPAILQYMDANYSKLSIQDISDHFHFQISYLSKIFKKHTGNTLINTLQKIRVSKARELLVSTSIPIEELAYMVGYQDTTHFIRVFKKHTDYTPAKYRMHFKSQE